MRYSKKPPIGIDDLRKVIAVDFVTGKIHWLRRQADDVVSRQWNSRFAGKEAFISKNQYGYLYGSVGDRAYMAHRVIWAMHNGRWPDHEIDHINGDRSDNRIGNLREATRSENMKNRVPAKKSTSKFLGVWLHNGKWDAGIRIDGRAVWLGSFESEVDAALEYDRAAADAHGEFARLNFGTAACPSAVPA